MRKTPESEPESEPQSDDTLRDMLSEALIYTDYLQEEISTATTTTKRNFYKKKLEKLKLQFKKGIEG